MAPSKTSIKANTQKNKPCPNLTRPIRTNHQPVCLLIIRHNECRPLAPPTSIKLQQESVDTEITQPLEEPSTLPPKTLSIPNPEPLDVQSTTPSTVPDPNNLKPSAVAQLRNNNKSDAVNSSQGDRGLTLSSALEDLAVAGLLKSLDKFGNIASVPETIISKVNVSKLRACLDLIDFAGNPFDMEILRDGKKAVGSSVQDAASRLTSTVLDKMFELEGTTAEIAQSGGNVPGEAVMGLSKRISRYRDNIKTVTGQEHIRTGKIALMEYTDYLTIW